MARLEINTESEALGLDVSLTVLLPERRPGPWPVLWLYHGLSDDHSAWTRKTSIERYVQGRGLAVVMPAVGRSYYSDMQQGLRYGTFVREELPAKCRRWFPLSAARADNFVAGLSMGGFGAVLAALLQPDRFGAAASLSGVLRPVHRMREIIREKPEREAEFRWIFGDLEGAESHPNNLERLLRERAAEGASLPRLFACCGRGDFLYEDNLWFRDRCGEWGVPLVWEEGEGEHTWEFWDAWIRRVLDWLLEGR